MEPERWGGAESESGLEGSVAERAERYLLPAKQRRERGKNSRIERTRRCTIEVDRRSSFLSWSGIEKELFHLYARSKGQADILSM